MPERAVQIGYRAPNRTRSVLFLMGCTYKSTQRWRVRAKEWLIKYGGGACQVCGYNRFRGNLTFHHIEGKSEDISRLVNATAAWDKILAEVDKCVLLCHLCHGEIHAGLIDCPPVNLQQRQIIFAADPRPEPKAIKRAHTCAKCGRPSTGLYCSSKCAHMVAEKASWPSDAELKLMVWRQPVTHIAASLGVSDRAVKKRCRRRGIDTPGQGYWQKRGL